MSAEIFLRRSVASDWHGRKTLPKSLWLWLERRFPEIAKKAVKLEVPDAPGGKANGGERNQTLAAVIANHPFTNAFVRTSSQSNLGESMSDQPNRRPDEANLAASMPAQKT
jgi:hypothetical protein